MDAKRVRHQLERARCANLDSRSHLRTQPSVIRLLPPQTLDKSVRTDHFLAGRHALLATPCVPHAPARLAMIVSSAVLEQACSMALVWRSIHPVYVRPVSPVEPGLLLTTTRKNAKLVLKYVCFVSEITLLIIPILQKCTACSIPNFSVASTIDQTQCSACLPGFVLSGGQCVESCPTGTFLDPKDNVTCSNCSSTCGTCAGSSTFCLTCNNNQLASGGSCVTSCPSNTLSSSGACVPCHPDCATCSGESFNQCSTCPPDRPVLSNGRCLPTCSKTEFFDTASGSCKNCDSSCASCSAAGSQGCLSCADSNSVLRGGSCVPETCTGGTSVVAGLGACLSDLVSIPQSDSSGTASGSAALPSITGLDTPTVIESGTHLQWWQILLMTLGVAFLILLLLVCWRRRARRKRAQATRAFAIQRGLDNNLTWRERIVRFGERLFGHQRSRPGPIALEEVHHDKLDRYNEAEEARYDVKYFDSSSHSSRRHDHRDPRYLSDLDKRSKHGYHSRSNSSSSVARYGKERDVDLNSMSDASMYTYVTGQPRRAADARQPVRAPPIPPAKFGSVAEAYPNESRFSISSYYASVMHSRDQERVPTPADEIARSFLERKRAHSRSPSRNGGGPDVDYNLVDVDRPQSRGPLSELARGEPFLRPNHTGSSGSSRNPFRR